jgi:hypothetical protein
MLLLLDETTPSAKRRTLRLRIAEVDPPAGGAEGDDAVVPAEVAGRKVYARVRARIEAGPTPIY